ncbi:putative nucleotidyltransferase substrate binding domain-containing protein [Alishewanella sp. d11]|uniref:putative nucleotidyltransferase substrate binding domain-containing protein n=1 Tax=Alishewanella sp. d11 TaxID=3414030 RepID=UPI003BF83FB7
MEVSEVSKFLAQTIPFDQLSPAQLAETSLQLSVYYCQQGEKLDIAKERLLIIRTGMYALYSDKQQLLTKLEEGDFYGYQLLLTGLADADQLICEEDGLVYWLAASEFHQLRYQYKNVDIFFQRLFGRRLHQYKEQQGSRFTLKIADIVQNRKVAICGKQSVQQAAQLMTEKRVSSLLVEENDRLIGILTDRDLRTRVLADDLPASTLIQQVMTPKPHTIDKHAYLFEAVQLMSRFNVHHLPVMEKDVSFGMITATDIIRSQQDHPVYLIGEIHRQDTVDGLTQCSLQINNLAQTLGKQLVPAHEAGHIITTITDALTQRLIKLAQQKLGPAPCVFTWLCFGSQARMDQSINADQDNALLLEREPTADIADYFQQLAEFVCQGLASCGITLCPGNIMASNPELRLSLKGWSGKFAKWISSPTPEAILKASIFFDMRVVEGSKGLFNALQQDILARTNNALFLYHLAQSSLQRTAPLSFLRNFILEHDGKQKKGIDLKKRGISLITDIVRIYALAHGVHEVNTRQRLQQLAVLGAIDPKEAQNLSDAFDVLAHLRWDKHLHDINQGHEASNLLDPAILSGLQRHQLKDSFAVINNAQSSIKHRFCKEV